MRELHYHRNVRYKALLLTALTFALIAPSLFAEAIGIGSTRDEVLESYGPPRARAQLGTKEIFTYTEGSVTCDNGRVMDFRFHGHEPAIRRRPIAEQVAPRVITKTVYVDRPVAINLPPAQTPLPTKSLFSNYWILVFAAGGLALMKMVAPRSRGRRSDHSLNLGGERSPPARQPGPSVSLSFMPAALEPVSRLNLVTLRKLEWRRVEELVQGYFEKTGLRAQRSAVGADGGIDLFLYRASEYKPIACVQCKMRSSADVGVKDIREFYGVIVSEVIAAGYFISTQGFTADAKAFAAGKPIQLIDAAELVAMFERLPANDHTAVVAHAFREDYITPTCASCDQKMVFKEANGGFWGCKSYPRCRRTLPASAGGR